MRSWVHTRCYLQKQPPEVFSKKGVLKNFRNFTGHYQYWSLFLIKLQALQVYQKETPIQVFSCEISEIFKNSYFEEHLLTTASVSNLVSDILVTAALEFLVINCNSSIFGRILLIKWMKWSPFLANASNFWYVIWCL